jgi:predicted MFS family arabinose efflux permease
MAVATQRTSLADLLRVPGFTPLFLASMAGRLPASALGLVLILRTRELTGSFAAGGAVAGAYALANGITAPLLGRLVDRRGQGPVLVPAALVAAVAITAFALLPHGVAVGPAIALAALIGATFPPLGPCLRTLWPAMLGDDPGRAHAAFSLEAAALEATYIVGPVVIAGAIGAWSTAAATLACAALLLGGVLAFCAHAVSRAWRPARAEHGHGAAGALRSPGVRTLMLVFALLGATFGSVEIAVPVAAEAAGHAGAAGLLLGVWGLGSLLGGLAAARAGAARDPVKRLTGLLAALAAGHALLAIPLDPLPLAVLLLVAGLALSPAIAAAYAMVEGLAPAGTVTEAYTWLSTGIAAGLAAGAALSGALAEAHGAGAAFVVAGAACATGAFAGMARRRTLVRA